MSKIEKTLELNITHEILSLADGFWWILQSNSFKRYWRPHFRFLFLKKPKSFATGLHINLEGKDGGGYDVCINSPANFQGVKPRLLFMQFKAGVEKQFSTNPESIFKGNETNPNVHVEFDINSNKNRNQHKLLQTLAQNAGNGNAVVYVFPRVVNEVQLVQNLGNLLNKTTFLSIHDIDTKAKEKGIRIDDKNPHKFRTCYNDWDKNEINLLLLLLGKIDNPGKYLGEIFAIRMYRGLQCIKVVEVRNYSYLKYYIINAMIIHVLNIGEHFSISFSDIKKYFNNYSQFLEQFELRYRFHDKYDIYQIVKTANEFVLEIFYNILDSLSLYFNWIEKYPELEYFNIPEPPKNFTIEFESEELRFRVDKLAKDNYFEVEDFNDITYSLF